MECARLGRVVITAHCLPELPPPHGASYTKERTYADFLSPLGQEPTVWADCLFVDPVADLAVLGSPDNTELSDEADAYEALMESVEPFRLGDLVTTAPAPDLGALIELEPARFAEQLRVALPQPILVPASVLSLEQKWTDCQVTKPNRRSLNVQGVRIDAGMSGSPVVVDDAAVGVIGLGVDAPQAELRLQLPVWIVQALEAAG